MKGAKQPTWSPSGNPRNHDPHTWSPSDMLGDSSPSKLVLSAHYMLSIVLDATDAWTASPA